MLGSATRAAWRPNNTLERVWRTASGKARFITFRGVDEDPSVSHPEMVRLATLRGHEQYNITIYSMNDRYRGVYGTRTVIFMNKDDMAADRIAPQPPVEIESLNGDRVERRVSGFTALPYDIQRGCAALLSRDQPAAGASPSRPKGSNAGSQIHSGSRAFHGCAGLGHLGKSTATRPPEAQEDP